jgi:hypothetical protein
VSSVAALPVIGKALGGKREDIEQRQRAELLRMARTSLFDPLRPARATAADKETSRQGAEDANRERKI